ncbi:MAG: DUF4956 domain-containing protein [Lachnospiraceae bacterium]|nr:DUF4956 domain-containing protein [Lachnospiraceae bacterium]
MGFQDIFKKSFLEGFANTELTFYHIMIVLMAVCILSLYIFFVYRLLIRNTFYSKSFNIALAAIAVITASIILTVQSSVVISLGMVGALSIVRFRTAIKEPMDLVFLFWSISIGIICGAGMIEVAVCTSLVLTAGIFILNQMPIAQAPMILLVHASDNQVEKAVLTVVKKYCRQFKVKNRTMTRNGMDMVVEVRVSQESELIEEVMQMKEIETATLVAHDGEVTF